MSKKQFWKRSRSSQRMPGAINRENRKLLKVFQKIDKLLIGRLKKMKNDCCRAIWIRNLKITGIQDVTTKEDAGWNSKHD